MLQWQESKDPSDEDFYAAKVDTEWLGVNAIESALFEAPEDSGLTIGAAGINGNEVRVRITGGNVGSHPITITIVSANRTRQRTVYLIVKER
jgi:hypothetical protein